MAGSGRARIRWSRTATTAAIVAGGGCALYLLWDRWHLLGISGRLRLIEPALHALWWGFHVFYVAALALALVTMLKWFVGRAGTSRTKHVATVTPRRRMGLHGIWLPSLAIVVMLEAASAALLWREGRSVLWRQPPPPLSESEPEPLPDHLPPGNPGEFRIAAMGGSSTAGFPYGRKRAFPELVGHRLQELFPDTRIVVENVAQPGATLAKAYENLHQLSALPDVLLIYSGHNEYLGRYDPHRVADPGEWRVRCPPLLARAIEVRLEHIDTILQMGGGRDETEPMRPLFDRPVCTPEEFAHRDRSFRRYLEATLAWCDRHRVLPLLIIPASSESGFEPCRSFLPEGFPPVKQQQLSTIYARFAESHDTANAQELLEEARDLCPSFALTWFMLGRLYEAQNQCEQARDAYQQALEHDGFPWHATAAVASAYEASADRWGCPLLDAREILRRRSPNGILGEAMFHDAHHLSLDGYLAVADAVLAALRAEGVPAPAQQSDEHYQIDRARVWEQFELSEELWAHVCDQIAKAYRSPLPLWHLLGRERLDRAQDFSEAARRLRAGAAVEQIGLPGIGVTTERSVQTASTVPEPE